uniref:Uncharacterized protein n=1 Tax=Romanomermis culicivorax TaxID=13658 RepID=A0A915JNM7_ROMCU
MIWLKSIATKSVKLLSPLRLCSSAFDRKPLSFSLALTSVEDAGGWGAGLLCTFFVGVRGAGVDVSSSITMIDVAARSVSDELR